MMGHEDAVHAPYYFLMHPVIAIGGTSATVLRLPSLIAMTLAAGLTGALGRRLAQRSGLPGPTAVGLLAGLSLAAVPLTTRYAQEARPYALATLFAVAASYAFARAIESPRWRRWVVYAAALLLAGLFNLFAVCCSPSRTAGPDLALSVARVSGQTATAVTGLTGNRRDRRGVVRRWFAARVRSDRAAQPRHRARAGQSSR
jgi:mannosyltransferase